jgi:hypothetical protein
MVVLMLRDPIHCGLLVLTLFAKCYQETGMHHWLCCWGSWLGSCHQIHGA